MAFLPYQPPKREYCKRCGATLNPYGVCPNISEHLAEDKLRHDRIQAENEEKKRRRKELWDSIIWPDTDKEGGKEIQ
jgi:predicted amidophosphoribosyltransferase